MKSKHLLLLLLMALMAPWAANAQQTLTLYGDGTTQSFSVPANIFYFNNFTRSQFVIPAEELAAMEGGTITSVKFYTEGQYLPYPTSGGVAAYVVVYLKEVDYTSISTFEATANCTTVQEGTLSVVAEGDGGTMTINFGTPYAYGGGNLLFGIENTIKADDKHILFLGKDVTGASIAGFDSNSLSEVTPGQKNFIPKTTFTYVVDPCKQPTLSQTVTTDATTATLTWTENGESSDWVLQYGENSEFLPYTYTEVTNGFTVAGTTVTAEIGNLSPLTQYYARVKPGCDTDDAHWSNTVAFTTQAQAAVVGDSWSDDFEGATCGWELINGTQTNKWVWGTAESNGGTHALYVSDNEGSSCHYETQGAERVYATRLLTFADGSYTFSFDWKCEGESPNYDYLSVGLLPATEQLTADNVDEGTLPEGWIALHDQACLQGQTTWQTTLEKTIQVAAGNYYLVLRWRQDGSGGSTHPAAVDNVSIARVACPYEVEGLAVASFLAPTAHTVTIIWNPGEATQWQVAYKLSTASEWTVIDEPVSEYTKELTGLATATTYQAKVRVYCGGTDYGTWCAPITFTTECETTTEFPYTERFDDLASGIPVCWDNSQGSTTTESDKWNYDASGHYGACVSFNSSSNSQGNDNYLKTHVIHIPYDRDMELTFWYKNGSYDNQFMVFIATSDDEYATTTALTGNLNLKVDWTEQGPISLAPYKGKDVKILFYGVSDHGFYNIYLDDVAIRQQPDCTTPEGLAVTYDSETPEGATITWNAGDATSWIVEYKKSTDENYTAIAEPVSMAEYTFTGLEANTTYDVRVKVDCEGAGIIYPTDPVSFTTLVTCPAPKYLMVSRITSTEATLRWTPGYNETQWTVKYKKHDDLEYTTAEPVMWSPILTLYNLTSGTVYDVQVFGCDETHVCTVDNAFSTPYEVPFQEKFNTNAQPTGWNQYTGLMAEVMSHTAELSSGGNWRFDNTYVFGQYQARLNVYGWNCNSWLVTPSILMADNQSLSFDLALTGMGSTGAISNPEGQLDDKFVVLITTNDGMSWSVLRQWDNAGSEYVYNHIATQGEKVYIDLANYSGQIVRIAFYGESTVDSNVDDNDIHVDNVSIAYSKVIDGYGEGTGNWYLVASPLADAVSPVAVGMITDDNSDAENRTYDLYYFDQTGANNDKEWKNYRNQSFDLNPGQGYLYASKAGVTLMFFDELYEGNGTIPLEYSNANPNNKMWGWNLIGNPFLTEASLDMPFFRMNEGGSGFTSQVEANSMVEAMEGVLVYAYDDDAQQAIPSATFSPGSRSSHGPQGAAVANISVMHSSDAAIDNAIVRFDAGKPLPKFYFGESDANIYIPQNGKEYAIVNAETQGALPINFKAEVNGSYTLSVNVENINMNYLHLLDNMTGADVDLLVNPSYTFNANVDDRENRFELVFATVSEDANDDDETFAFFSNGNLIVNGTGTLQVIDLLGHQLVSRDIHSSFLIPHSAFPTPGVYMLRLVSGEKVKVQKVVVR